MKTKTFDCIKMKEECQRAVEKKYGGLTPDERHKRMRADLLQDPVLGDLYRRTYRPDGLVRPSTVCTIPNRVIGKVAETQTQYNTASEAE